MTLPDASHWTNSGLPVGRPLPNWEPPPRPDRRVKQGRTCRLEPLDAGAYGDDLWSAFERDESGVMWTYLPDGPFATRTSFDETLSRAAGSEDPLFFAVIASDHAIGFLSYLRIDTDNGVIEVGYVTYSPALQRTVAATEAQVLMAREAFALGYRRYEWKCDALNAPSRAAAIRLGFTFEGIFRNARVTKGRNRDTAWFSITDDEWPRIERAYDAWLDPENFDDGGRQRRSLRHFH